MILIDYLGLDLFVRIADGQAHGIYSLTATRPDRYANITRLFVPHVAEAIKTKAIEAYADILEDEAA